MTSSRDNGTPRIDDVLRMGGPVSSNGIVAELPELLRCRPDRRLGGFAPGGRVTTHCAGQNLSVFNGRGMEFDEARVYQPGDDVRAIDWRVTARTGTVHTKLYREERERPVLMLVDCRRGMQFGTRVRFKSVLAARLAAMLSWIALDGVDRVGGLLLGPDGLGCFPSTRSRVGLLAWLHAISDATRLVDPVPLVDREVSLSEGLRHLRRVARPGSLAFVISDFSDLDDAADAELSRLALQSHVTSLLVYDRLEETLPSRGAFRISDGNYVAALASLGNKRRIAYESEFSSRRDRLERLARRRGSAFLALSTSDDPTLVLQPAMAAHTRVGARRAAA